ncbi:STAS domain-containing protein [Actinacidiphila glaucinigra]|uniref:Anti-sigma factor antagonist n=1 Tax=Actinacidiphila glaucinigra TaxID=235986 RepID=A0A239NTN4_9ACTN|nr:STAS domain-containing protein [Actinacidiphila glaucinigra]SNT58205.1 anti-sigma B factor antagonist [Actinacidiphila glaucinigra]
MQNIEIDVDEAGALTTIALAGELDLATCPQVTEVTDAVQLCGRTLCIDLSGITFMGSTSLNMLLRLRMRAEAEGGALELAGLQHQAERVLVLTGARDLFRIRPRISAPAQVTSLCD